MQEKKPNYYGMIIIIFSFVVISMSLMGGFRLAGDYYYSAPSFFCPLRESLIQYKSLVGWDIYRAGGNSVLSSPDSIFFEVTYILYLIFNDANIAIALGAIIYVSLGIVGMYLLLFKLTKSNKSSILSCIFFFLNGFFIAEYAKGRQPNYITPYVLLPWIFLLYFSMGKNIKKIIINSILIGVLLTIAFLASGMPLIVWIIFMLPIFLIFDLFILKNKNISFLFKVKKIMLIVIIMLVIFSGLSAFKLYPGAKFIEKTNRNSVFPLDNFIGYKLESKDFLSVIMISRIGDNFMGIGIMASIFILMGLLLGFRKKNFWRFFILFILGIVITANFFSIAKVLHLIPVLNKTRHMIRFAGIFQFSVAVLMGLSLSYIYKSLAKKRLSKYKNVLFIIIIILLSFELVYTQIIKNDLFTEQDKLVKLELDRQEPLKYISNLEAERHRIHMLGKDWVTSGTGDEHFCSLGIETMDWVFGNAWLVDYTTFTHLAGSNLEKAAKLWGILNVKYITAEDPNKINPVYTKDVFNYKNETDYSIPNLNLIKRFPPCEKCMPDITLLYENKRFLPRIFLVDKSILLMGEKDKLYSLYNFLLLNDNFEPKTTVLINKNEIKDENLNKYTAIIITDKISNEEIQKLREFRNSGGILFPDIFSNENQINIEKLNALLQDWNKESSLKEFKEVYYSPNHRIYETKENLKGFAVVSENFYTYKDIWLASLNSKNKEIYSANFVVSAIYLDDEKGKLEFKYNPIYFKIGSIISIITLLTIILVFVFLNKYGKHS